MGVRIRYKISATVSSTDAEEKDLANQSWEVVTDVEGEGGSWKTTVAAAAADEQLYLGNLVTSKIILIRTTATDPTQPPGDMVFKKNSPTGEQLTVRPIGDSKEGHLVISSDGITALYVSNVSTVSMDVTVVSAGD